MVLGATTPAIAALSPPPPISGPSSTRFNGLHGRFSPSSSPPRYLRPSIVHKGFGSNRLRSTISATVSSEVGSVTAESNPPLSLEVSEIKKMCSEWKWRGYSINYLVVHGSDDEEVAGSLRPPPVLLVHGFGASIAHWRRSAKFAKEDRIAAWVAFNWTIWASNCLPEIVKFFHKKEKRTTQRRSVLRSLNESTN